MSKLEKAYQHLAAMLQNPPSPFPQPGSPWREPGKAPPQFPMPWASHWGQDEFGLWCTFTLEQHQYRFRWIPPGQFLMGSPKDEPERRGGEQLHEVKLTQGFWLADTACEQRLWRQVVGNDPSRFQGENLPVERVSWKDIEQFFLRLNKRLPGLEARLPTEAEWEYACRAGTQTAFWWGNELNTDLANYDGNRPYDKGAKEKFRKKALPVKRFIANPWGLYQMHGNVCEWCVNWYEGYPQGMEIDPQGADTGDFRVFRGGSWLSNGQWLRAADRLRRMPGDRSFDLGFRLALGPRPGGAQAEGAAVSPALGSRGAGERSRDK